MLAALPTRANERTDGPLIRPQVPLTLVSLDIFFKISRRTFILHNTPKIAHNFPQVI